MIMCRSYAGCSFIRGRWMQLVGKNTSWLLPCSGETLIDSYAAYLKMQMSCRDMCNCWFVITAICFWNMDTIDSWYSETRGLLCDKSKANTRHPLVWICHKRRSRHPLTAAVHRWSYKLEETLSLWPRQAYGSGCSCTLSLHLAVTTGLRTVWHLEKTTRPSTKMLGGVCHHQHRALSFWCLECCDVTTHRQSSVRREGDWC